MELAIQTAGNERLIGLSFPSTPVARMVGFAFCNIPLHALAPFPFVRPVLVASLDRTLGLVPLRPVCGKLRFGRGNIVRIGVMSGRGYVRLLVRTAGLEPARGCPQGILSPLRLPFRHVRAGVF
jgi:hypothetical protein